MSGLASCPAEEPVDSRAFIEEIFRASVVCFPSFLAEAEPVFLRAQVEAQLEIAVANFERNLENEAVEFSRGAYDACLQATAANDCEAISADDGVCASVFRGTLDEDEACAEPVECAPGLSCFQERDQCGVCRPLAVTGDSCADRPCVDGDFCEEGICRRQPEPSSFAAGDACTPQPGCGGVLSGLACIDLVCQPITIVDVGEACEVGPTSDRYCRDSSTTSFCDNGVCTARPALGEACATFCDISEAICIDGSCVDEGRVGDACASALECQVGSTCEQGACTARVDAPTPPVCD